MSPGVTRYHCVHAKRGVQAYVCRYVIYIVIHELRCLSAVHQQLEFPFFQMRLNETISEPFGECLPRAIRIRYCTRYLSARRSCDHFQRVLNVRRSSSRVCIHTRECLVRTIV